eukprot:CAMPEP_0117515280 /NCGR_PEP_ID=MMETSP0784-20121206/30500_1 /TAXON_ID=39447 /ORGANISM="" /LENGTH=497 /DNA_ID=CAMNT_0005311095 /DNA_START=74 /DNA_END=1568 /DNA_ORIENTATION=-
MTGNSPLESVAIDQAEVSSSNVPRAKTLRPCPLYVQVILAIFLGVLFGHFLPESASNLWIKALGVGFVNVIKMAIAPIVFCTVVSGIAHVGDAAKVGRVAVKAILYFEIISSVALAFGLVVANLVRPGQGFDAQPDEAAVAKYSNDSIKHTTLDFVMHIIPKTIVGAFAEGEILQVLFVALLFGFAIMAQGDRAQSVQRLIDELGRVMLGIITVIMKFAPIGAFGAMAYTVGKYGVGTLGNLVLLVATFYVTSIVFVLAILGAVAAIARFNILRFLFYIKDELLIVLATSSSESVLPAMLTKLEALGCSKSVVGLVVPLGYSCNLDGTNIYMTLVTLFICQSMGIHLSFGEQLNILFVTMLTSKGAAGVSGAGFITLASTLSAVRPELVPGMAVVLGIDKFMAECRSLTNLIGNGVATVVVAAAEGELDRQMMNRTLQGIEVKADEDLEDKLNVLAIVRWSPQAAEHGAWTASFAQRKSPKPWNFLVRFFLGAQVER